MFNNFMIADSWSVIGEALLGCSDDVGFLLRGDQAQIDVQERFLQDSGFRIGRAGSCPGFYTGADFKSALALIWSCRVDGWWLYGQELMENDICSLEDYQAVVSAVSGALDCYKN